MINFLTIKVLAFFDYFHKRKIIDFFKCLNLKNINIIFDVGGHKGETILFFLKNFRINKIISFEASELNFEKLKKNSYKLKKIFPGTNIIIENLALGAEKKIKKFKQFTESSSSTFSDINTNSSYFKKKFRFLNIKKDNNFFFEENLNLATLQDYIDKEKIDYINILKIDTEGFEFEILKGLKQKIEIIDIIYFEHHYDNMVDKKYTFRDIHNHLNTNNFKRIYKIKMPFRKTFEYIYRNKDKI
jgi:FkbM family methyltransferase